MDQLIEDEISKIETNQNKNLLMSTRKLPYFRPNHFVENVQKKHTPRNHYVLLPQIMKIDTLKKHSKDIEKQYSPERMTQTKKSSLFAKAASDPNLLGRSNMQKFHQLTEHDQLKTIHMFNSTAGKERQETPGKQEVRQLDLWEQQPKLTLDQKQRQTVEQIVEWNNGRNFTYLNWMPYNGAQVNKELRNMVDINSLDRLNFSMTEETMGQRKFEILTDKSINGLIDTWVKNESIMSSETERKRRIAKKLDHLDSELKLLEKYKPKAEEQWAQVEATVVDKQSTEHISATAEKGWTPLYSKDFRPMCMIKSKSERDVVSPTLPMSSPGVKKKNVHDMQQNEQDKFNNKVQFSDTIQGLLRLQPISNTKMDVLMSNRVKFQQQLDNAYSTQDVLTKESNQIHAKIDKIVQEQKIIKQNILTSWKNKVSHLLGLLKSGKDPRESGLSWIVTCLWMMGLPINLKDITSVLDQQSRQFLLAKARLQLGVAQAKFLTFKDNDMFGSDNKDELKNKSDSFIRSYSKKKLSSLKPERIQQYKADSNKAGMLEDDNTIDNNTYVTKTSFSMFKSAYNLNIDTRAYDNLIAKKEEELQKISTTEYQRIMKLFERKSVGLDATAADKLQTKVHQSLQLLFGFGVDQMYKLNLKSHSDFKQLMHQDIKDKTHFATTGKLLKMVPNYSPSVTPDHLDASLRNMTQNSQMYQQIHEAQELRNKYQTGTLYLEVPQDMNLDDSKINLHNGNNEFFNQKIINNTDQWEFYDLRNVGDQIN